MALKYLLPLIGLMTCLIFWQLASGALPSYVLPSPATVVASFIDQFPVIMEHSAFTVAVALLGLCIAVSLALLVAFLMDAVQSLYDLLYPPVIISQTIPLIALAPLFVLWFGFGILPKVLVVVLVCFFPILINLLKGFTSLNREYIDMMRSMGANTWQIIHHVKLPGAAPAFFAGLRIATTYSIMGAVIGEWLGGATGLGVYLIRSQKAFATSRLFAAILMIIALSLMLLLIVKVIERPLLAYRRYSPADP